MKTNSILILSLLSAFVISACSTPEREVAAAAPATKATPLKLTSEEVKLGEITVAMATDCRIVFTNRDQRKAQWSLPITGPCYFAKNRAGKIDVYTPPSKNKAAKSHVILAFATVIEGKTCDGMNAAIIVNEGRVLVATPPFSSYATCTGPTGGFDEKVFSNAWHTMLKNEKYEEVNFPSK